VRNHGQRIDLRHNNVYNTVGSLYISHTNTQVRSI